MAYYAIALAKRDKESIRNHFKVTLKTPLKPVKKFQQFVHKKLARNRPTTFRQDCWDREKSDILLYKGSIPDALEYG